MWAARPFEMNITEREEQRGHTLVLCCKYEAHLWLRLYCVAMRGEKCRVARTLRGEVRAGERQPSVARDRYTRQRWDDEL